MSADLLTILLPLKGRPLFTLRFLWHAERCRLPFRLLVADGEVDPVLARLIEEGDAFPHLDLTYRRYPDDASLADYWRKMADAMAQVRTPYVMLADNDDFLAPAGIAQCLAFLAARPDYVCCGGGNAGFAVYAPQSAALPHVVGPFNRFDYRYSPFDKSEDFAADTVAERVVAGLRNQWSYYAICRTAAAQTIWRETVEIGFTDLLLHEIFAAARTLTLGKARSDPAVIGYLRQHETSLYSASSRDWVDHLLTSRFTSDFHTLVERIAGLAAAQDGSDPAVLEAAMRRICGDWLRDLIAQFYGRRGDLIRLKQRLRAALPPALYRLRKRRSCRSMQERRALFAHLRRDGATPTYEACFAAELAEIEATLTDGRFAAFLAERAPTLLAARRR